MSHTYATVADFAAYLSDNGSVATALPETRVRKLLEAASRRVDGFCDRSEFQSGFGPRTGTNHYDGDGGFCLDLEDDVLAVTELRVYDVPGGTAYHTAAQTTDWFAVPAEPWWCIANADTELAPGDLDRLALEMEKPGPRWVGMNGDWRVFGINRECVETVGFFDENFHPCYCEDADYEYRCTLAGVPWYSIPGGASHVGSAAIASDPAFMAANARTYPANRAYYEAKWGGPLRGGERFMTPFECGASVRDWTLGLRRVRELAW